jgi:hypothetical protein
LLVATVQDHARSRVAAGENQGRVLEHVSVARSLAVVGRGDGEFSGAVRVRVTRTGGEGVDRVVVVVQPPGAGPVLAAATTTLP